MKKVNAIVEAPVMVEPTQEVVNAVVVESVPTEFVDYVAKAKNVSVAEALKLIDKLVNGGSTAQPKSRGKFIKLTADNNPAFAEWQIGREVEVEGEKFKIISASFYENYADSSLYLKLANDAKKIADITFRKCKLV